MSNINHQYIIALFCIIDDILKEIGEKYIGLKKCRDSEVIFAGVVSALFFSSNRKKTWEFLNALGMLNIDYSRFIRRVNKLSEVVCNIQKIISELVNSETKIIDSIPSQVCERERSWKNRKLIGKEWIGYLHIKGEYYLGLKVHLIVSEDGIPLNYVVTPASYHDIEGLKIMASEIKGGKVIGDKAYNSQRLYKEFEEKGVKLLAIPKKKRDGGELNPADLSEEEVKEIKSKRMVIETVFSALTRMGIKKLFAVSLKGLLSKISYIILAYSISKLINLKLAI